MLKSDGILFVNLQIGNPCLFSRDGRFFEYNNDDTRFRHELFDCGFKNEYIIRREVKRNTYGENIGSALWSNFYALKGGDENAAEESQFAEAFTADAYGRSAMQFAAVHTHDASDRRTQFVDSILGRIAELALKNAPRLLDIGCGVGDLCSEAARRHWSATGIDITPEMISIAKQSIVQDTINPDFHVMDMRRLPPEWSKKFDAIVCMTALQHVPNKPNGLVAALVEFRRVLNSGGILLVDARLGDESGYDPDGRYIQKFDSAQSFSKILDKSGFEVLDTKVITLEPGKNSFRRPISIKYATFWCRKI
jgi:SAM-dependent methyltransferase